MYLGVYHLELQGLARGVRQFYLGTMTRPYANARPATKRAACPLLCSRSPAAFCSSTYPLSQNQNVEIALRYMLFCPVRVETWHFLSQFSTLASTLRSVFVAVDRFYV